MNRMVVPWVTSETVKTRVGHLIGGINFFSDFNNKKFHDAKDPMVSYFLLAVIGWL